MKKKPRELYGIFRIETKKKEGKTATIGWQVRLTFNKKSCNKLFSDSVLGSNESALKAAKKFRDEQLIKHHRYGVSFGRNFSTELNKSNTTGIIGVNRTEYLEKSSSITEAWQTAYPTLSGKVGTKSMSIKRKGEMHALKVIINDRMEGVSNLIGTAPYAEYGNELRFLVDYYLNILVYFDSLSKQQEDSILEIINNKNIKNTEKADVINGRVGQQSFRDRLLRFWGNKCAITGSNLFIVSSHIKPWAASTDRERLDVHNGIPLSPVYDKAFDKGYISFKNDGSIMISKDLLKEDNNDKLKILADENINEIPPFSYPYLEHHRNKIFRG